MDEFRARTLKIRNSEARGAVSCSRTHGSDLEVGDFTDAMEITAGRWR
jgi:hypothetical protein